jgi:hypothetical protein
VGWRNWRNWNQGVEVAEEEAEAGGRRRRRRGGEEVEADWSFRPAGPTGPAGPAGPEGPYPDLDQEEHTIDRDRKQDYAYFRVIGSLLPFIFNASIANPVAAANMMGMTASLIVQYYSLFFKKCTRVKRCQYFIYV